MMALQALFRQFDPYFAFYIEKESESSTSGAITFSKIKWTSLDGKTAKDILKRMPAKLAGKLQP
jgi:hypothetical protein